ncbi:hypothetical protein [Deferribacter abyssi]|uniref:hypothetical protein n=1 Tax=Deferribacter abyssi TaxID=213806 RepID=UPI003C162D50
MSGVGIISIIASFIAAAGGVAAAVIAARLQLYLRKERYKEFIYQRSFEGVVEIAEKAGLIYTAIIRYSKGHPYITSFEDAEIRDDAVEMSDIGKYCDLIMGAVIELSNSLHRYRVFLPENIVNICDGYCYAIAKHFAEVKKQGFVDTKKGEMKRIVRALFDKLNMAIRREFGVDKIFQDIRRTF